MYPRLLCKLYRRLTILQGFEVINAQPGNDQPLKNRSESPYERNFLSESELEALRLENEQYKEREKSLLARISQLE